MLPAAPHSRTAARGGLARRFTAALALLLMAPLFFCQCAAPRARSQPALRMNPDASTWTCRDGKVLPFTHWPGAPAKPRAVVICVHGLSGAASDFWPVGESFPGEGFAVYAMELRGQGYDPDPKMRGDIRSSLQWRRDLLDFTDLVSRKHAGAPVFWFGESLGALIVTDTLASLPAKQQTVAGMILTSPVVEFRANLKLGFWKNLAVRTALVLCPARRISLERLGNSEVQVTSQTTHRQQMQHTPHYVKDFTLRLFAQIEKLVLRSGPAAAGINVPSLVFYTPNDALTPREGVEKFFSRLTSEDKASVFFPESYHLILHDQERSRALQVLLRWLKGRSSRP